ncbi:TPA: tyrosine-type recombinase/integrase [Enterobacter asburiae]|nr:tyrosine-type recombinase/integrase [Enterobacter asburiae]
MKRRFLTHNEISRVIQSLSGSAHEVRNRCLIAMCYLHGFRASELTGIKLSDIELNSKKIYIRRLKNGLNTSHPLQITELEHLREWLSIRDNYNQKKNDWLFLSRFGNRLSRQYFYKLIRQHSIMAGLDIQAHPHMLRHGCGYELAEQGMDTRLIQDYLGHRNIRHTVHYTASNAARFSRVWKPTGDPYSLFLV